MDADELYALAPEEFTAARTATAKAARAEGDPGRAAALTALRRPSVAAWLVNLVAHQRADLLEQVLGLGPALAQAQACGRGDQLRVLGEQRRALVAAVVDAAVELAARPVSGAVRGQVAGTFEAALADPASADAVRSGRLVRALSYAGFGGVDLSDAVAAPPGAPGGQQQDGRGGSRPGQDERPVGQQQRGRRAEQRRQALATAEQTVLAASGLLDDAVSTARRAGRRQQAAALALRDADAALEATRLGLERAEQVRADAARGGQAADEQAEAAVEAVASAQEAAERARHELDALRRSP